ncbi:MAG: hypothetical protein WC764_04435 [Candidatus Paceibacterota bacterium]|jgi:hypothetical protein
MRKTKRVTAKKKDAQGKAPYRVLHPISWLGERVERGSILGMTAADAKNIGASYLELVDKEKEEKKEKEEAEQQKEIAGSEIDI